MVMIKIFFFNKIQDEVFFKIHLIFKIVRLGYIFAHVGKKEGISVIKKDKKDKLFQIL